MSTSSSSTTRRSSRTSSPRCSARRVTRRSSPRTGEEALDRRSSARRSTSSSSTSCCPASPGMEVLRQIRQRDPEQVVVVITAFSSIEGAIEAMREGAFHYIPKPFKNEEVLLTVRKGLEQRRLRAENRALARASCASASASTTSSASRKPMQQVFELIRLAAPSKSNILILGESGTGKELVAKAIHHHSQRADGPFVTVNSGSMPPDLLESNLFGHVKGAFTGAIASKKGLFEIADQRLDLLRRDRQHPARHPGQAAARDPGEGVHAPRRRRDAQGRRAHHRRHQRRPRQSGRSRAPSARTSTTG